jgi:hypothetical protein
MTPTPENRRESRQRNRRETSAQSGPESARPRFAPLWVIALSGLGGIAIAGAVVFEMQRGKPPVALEPTAPISMPNPLPAAPPITQALPPASAPQPPGEAPPGKAWNAEHGHWHDAPATASPGAPPITPAAQPPGEAPPGKVWNAEHGHWHDAPPKPQ